VHSLRGWPPGEVKNLASRNARAAAEIGEMIGSIQREAREGPAAILQLVSAIKESKAGLPRPVISRCE